MKVRESKVKWNGLTVQVVGSGRSFTMPLPPKGSEAEAFLLRYGIKQWTADGFSSKLSSADIEKRILICTDVIESGIMPERSRNSVPSTTKIMAKAQEKGLSADEMALLQKLLSKLA